MSTYFATGRNSIAYCDVCGFECEYKELKALVVNQQRTQTLACADCWVPDHPQLQAGKRPVYDPQALRNPRPDANLTVSRAYQWGWNPVGGGNSAAGTPNALAAVGYVGTVTVTVA